MIDANKKHKGSLCVDEQTDRISKLPDTIIQHILSFLSTKEAVGTCLLAKGWKNTWTFIPNLEFIEPYEERDGPSPKRDLLMTFVERALVHNNSSNLQHVVLDFDVLDEKMRVNSCISASVRRKVKNFNVQLYNVREPFVLPHCLFTCESLEVLDLYVECVLNIPTSIYFSNLKVLKLSDIRFPDDHSTNELFSGCRVLEELTLNDCYWINVREVTIHAPTLQRLEITDCGSERHSTNGCRVIIVGGSLTVFSYAGDLRIEFCFSDVPSLVDVCIEVFDDLHRELEVARHLHIIFTAISSATKLTLLSAVQALSSGAELFARVPMFHKLTRLVFEPTGLYSEPLVNLLQKFRILKTLVLQFEEEYGIYGDNYEREDEIWNSVPPCFLSHLKNIVICRFFGPTYEAGVYLVKILLKHASVLERMVICINGFGMDPIEQEQVQDELLRLPKASPSCSIIFK